jgi:hypothetical protein
VKYVGKEHAQHLNDVLQQKYTITTDWIGALYVGLHIKCDYVQLTVDISMTNHVTKALQRFKHKPPSTPQHAPHSYTPPQYGAKVQLTLPPDTSPALSVNQIERLQQIIGPFLYYTCAVDSTMLVTLGTLADAKTKDTTKALAHVKQFLDNASTHPDATIHYSASPMILTIHIDASYRSESEARSRVGGIFYLSSTYQPDTSVATNGAIHITSVIVKHVMASAAKAKLAGLFYNAQEACSFRTTLEELGHPQPPTAIQTDNECANRIANDKAMDMRFYWIRDRIQQLQFLSLSNKADYFTKHHSPAHHQTLRYTYLQGNAPIL